MLWNQKINAGCFDWPVAPSERAEPEDVVSVVAEKPASKLPHEGEEEEVVETDPPVVPAETRTAESQDVD